MASVDMLREELAKARAEIEVLRQRMDLMSGPPGPPAILGGGGERMVVGMDLMSAPPGPPAILGGSGGGVGGGEAAGASAGVPEPTCIFTFDAFNTHMGSGGGINAEGARVWAQLQTAEEKAARKEMSEADRIKHVMEMNTVIARMAWPVHKAEICELCRHLHNVKLCIRHSDDVIIELRVRVFEFIWL